MNDEAISFEQVEALGISRQAYDEVLDIVGHIPSIDQLSTLLAMWQASGTDKSLYGWLRGQQHAVERDEYLYSSQAPGVPEPRIKECLDIARQICRDIAVLPHPDPMPTGTLLYMVGNISGELAGSEYARKCLHLVDSAMATGGHDEDCAYIEMILQALHISMMVNQYVDISAGGIFMAALAATAPHGFDILVPREVRLDAFLFGEEAGRYIAAIDETSDDAFLLKLGEARLNCCFLGRVTKGRIVVDGYDFGPTRRFLPPQEQEPLPSA